MRIRVKKAITSFDKRNQSKIILFATSLNQEKLKKVGKNDVFFTKKYLHRESQGKLQITNHLEVFLYLVLAVIR